eukprot:12689319-Alexandrium_andersonii.AAC.1
MRLVGENNLGGGGSQRSSHGAGPGPVGAHTDGGGSWAAGVRRSRRTRSVARSGWTLAPCWTSRR